MSDLTGDDSKMQNSNLDTLLEAAKFLEQRSEGPATSLKTRGETRNFHAYSKAPRDRDDVSSPEKGSSSEEGKRRPGGAGTREVHNKLEKNRRAHLKECFDTLKRQIPSLDDKKTSNLSILRCALRYIQMLKRKEKEYEQELQRLAQEKIASQVRIAALKKDLNQLNVDIDINNFIKHDDQESNTDSTATAENESPIISDDEGENGKRSSRKSNGSLPNGTVPHPAKPPVITVVSSTALTLPVTAVSAAKVLPSTIASNLKSQSIVSSNNQLTAAILTAPTVARPAVVVSSVPTTPPSSNQPFKTPVTQLLQQTLAQRALQQKLQQQLQQQHQHQLQNGTVITLTQNGLRQVAAQAIRPAPTATVKGQTISFNQLLPSMLQGASIITAPGSLSTALSSTVPITLMATNNALAALPKMVTSTVPSSTHTLSTSTANNNMVTFKLQAPLQAHIVNTATGNQLTSLSQLMSSQMGKSTSVTTIPTLTPLTQMFSPMTVMAPAGQVNPALNNVVNPSVIKSLGQIPILQQPFNLSQALLKPMVMMAPTSVVTTSTATGHVIQAPVTQHNS